MRKGRGNPIMQAELRLYSIGLQIVMVITHSTFFIHISAWMEKLLKTKLNLHGIKVPDCLNLTFVVNFHLIFEHWEIKMPGDNNILDSPINLPSKRALNDLLKNTREN